MSRAQAVVCAAAITTLVAAAAGITSELADGSPNSERLWVYPLAMVALAAPTFAGSLIALRQPANTVAWVMILGGLAIVLLPVPGLNAIVGDGWSQQISRATWPLLYAWPIAVAFLFPGGRLLSRRWRWVAGAAFVSFVGFMSIAMLDPSPFEGTDAKAQNPLLDNRLSGWIGIDWIWVPFWIGILASLFAGAASVWLRFRRSSGSERLQVMWLAWSASLIPIGLVLCGLSWVVLDFGFLDMVVFPFLLLMQVLVACSIAIAVVRYRLYAIERLVNRTAVYAVLTVLLGALYAAVTAALGVAVGGGSAWVTALATLAVAVAFRPARSRIQLLVDRRFDRARYEGLQAVERFEREVREGRRAPEEIGLVLAVALRDASARLLFWLPASESYANAAGELVAEPGNGARGRTEVTRDAARTALLLHDPALLVRRVRLDELLSAAGLSIEIARLRVELRLQLAEVEASRARIVEAGYEERRRLERDLHDGAQQRLVSLGMRVRRLQRSLPQEALILTPAFDKIVDEIASAVSDLRQIAAGVRPARLDAGLAAALDDLARNVPIPVEVDAHIPRVAASVEAAAYFVACEALTNAVKHASASLVRLSAIREDGSVRVSVADDGVGGAVTRRGSGLAGLRDRVAAHGGTFEIVSPPGGGTRIEVALPCDS